MFNHWRVHLFSGRRFSNKIYEELTCRLAKSSSLRSADVFPVVASLPPFRGFPVFFQSILDSDFQFDLT